MPRLPGRSLHAARLPRQPAPRLARRPLGRRPLARRERNWVRSGTFRLFAGPVRQALDLLRRRSQIELAGATKSLVDHHTKELFRYRRRRRRRRDVPSTTPRSSPDVDAARRRWRRARATAASSASAATGTSAAGAPGRRTGAGPPGRLRRGNGVRPAGRPAAAHGPVSPPDAGWPDRSQPIEKSVGTEYGGGRLTVVLARAESSAAALVTRPRSARRRRGDPRGPQLDDDARFWARRAAAGRRLARALAARLRLRPRDAARDRAAAGRASTARAGTACRSRSRASSWPRRRSTCCCSPTPTRTTAKEVMLGTFRDAIAPNVPCTREDGSVNMVAVDGQACGTSPAWCWPFWCIGSDLPPNGRQSLAGRARTAPRVVPGLVAGQPRSARTAQPFYLCGWESGQDAVAPLQCGRARRRRHRADPAGRPGRGDRAVGPAAGKLAATSSARDPARWAPVADEYAHRTRAMWHRGWFHDWTAAADRPARPDAARAAHVPGRDRRAGRRPEHGTSPTCPATASTRRSSGRRSR